MKLKLAFVCSLAVALGSCNHKPSIETKATGGAAKGIFYRDKISALISNNVGKQKEANALYQKAVVAFRKERKTEKAVELLESSLRLYPTARTYFELGNAYASLKNYFDALMCYDLAEQMGFTPVSKLLYNMSCAYSLDQKPDKSLEYLEYAIEAGFVNKKQMMHDSDLTNIRNAGFSEVFRTALEGIESPGEVGWEGFLQVFSAIMLPVSIDLNSGKKMPDGKFLSYSFEQFVPEMHEREKFSRGTGNVFYAYGLVEQNNNYTALIYAEGVDEEMDGEQPLLFFLVSYDRKGTIIDKMQISGPRSLGGLCLASSMNSNLSFEVKEFENTYEKLVESSGYGDNKLISSSLKNTHNFRINDQGKFIESGPAMGSIQQGIYGKGKG